MLCRQVIRAAGDNRRQIWSQTAQYQLGCIYLEWGLLDDARRALERADQEAEDDAGPMRSRIRVALAAWPGHEGSARRPSTRSSRPSASPINWARCNLCATPVPSKPASG